MCLTRSMRTDAPFSLLKATRLGQQHEWPRQCTKSRFPAVQKSYLLLTFMLPNAEGCGTGLQLSAKEVVLGRPDIFQSEIPRVSQSKIRSVVLNESVSTHGKQFASDLIRKMVREQLGCPRSFSSVSSQASRFQIIFLGIAFL